MAVVKLLNLLAVSCLAIIASYGPVPVAALSVSHPHARSNLHHAMIKRKRATTSKRCKPRATPAQTGYSHPTSTKSASGSGSNNGGSNHNSNTTNSSNNNNNNNNNGGYSGSGGAKVGIAWADGGDTSLSIKNFKGPKVSTYYTWSPWCLDDDAGLECCPMLWGSKQISDFTKNVKPGYAKCVLGFNEPDQKGQSNMSPQDAANLWRQYIDDLSNHGYRTISPACTSAPNSKQWMLDFFSHCQGCHVDAIAMHWYGTDAEAFIAYVEDFHKTFNKNIWITEFADQDFSGQNKQSSKDEVFNFMKTVTAWMDSTPYVERYFAFGAMQDMNNVNVFNQLMGSNGLPNTLGQLYIGKQQW